MWEKCKGVWEWTIWGYAMQLRAVPMTVKNSHLDIDKRNINASIALL